MEGFWAWPMLGLFAQQAAVVELAWSENKHHSITLIMKLHITLLTLMVLIGVVCLLVFPDQ